MTSTAGDTAVALLKAGAETDKKDTDGCLALDLAPDKDVCSLCPRLCPPGSGLIAYWHDRSGNISSGKRKGRESSFDRAATWTQDLGSSEYG